ncbi:hypothetical protein MPSEU_001060500 [Mayamaea pseudoterrestris]|nr:hypothetical protein MPSEU_001060500 [Mayamaea pseudoterrestris]
MNFDATGDQDEYPENLNGETQLSQDECVVWNEGCGVDLRRLASPTFRTPGAARETPSSGPSNTSSASSSGETVKRRAATRKPRPSLSEVTRIIAAHETNQTGANKKSNNNLISRKRRRRQCALQEMVVGEKSTNSATAKPLDNNRKLSPMPLTKTPQSRNNEFASLLQQVKTPPDDGSNTNAAAAAEVSSSDRTSVETKSPLVRDNSHVAQKMTISDEFDDLDLSMDDFAALDALVQATQKENAVNQTETIHNLPSFGQCQSPAAIQKVSKQVVNHTDDEFGDFPNDIDFAAFDDSITQQISQQNVHAAQSDGILPATQQNQARQSVDAVDGCLTYSRYRVLWVHDDKHTFTKTLTVAAWRTEMLEEVALNKSMHKADDFARRYESLKDRSWAADGLVHLCGEWYLTPIEQGDYIHICSLSGQLGTDADALPLTLRTISRPGTVEDDYLLIVHPDMLLTPTVITEGISCVRRAVLKNRLGSTGLTSIAPLYGTMRHELFEASMRENNFAIDSARRHISRIIRENADGLLACKVTPREAAMELIKFVPQLQAFASQYTCLGNQISSKSAQLTALEPCGLSAPIRCRVLEVEAVEEPVVSPELGLKGNIDMLVKASTESVNITNSRPDVSTMCVELKTGHIQRTNDAHVAQLVLYMIMRRSRFVADCSSSTSFESAGENGMLLYMNNDAARVVSSNPSLSVLKSLLGQRNQVAIETLRAARPRGDAISFQNAPDTSNGANVELLGSSVAALPELPIDAHKCQKCYMNRECMLYAAAATKLGPLDSPSVHKDLLQAFTGHLQSDDLAYFQHFDRLIDLEADAEHALITQAWLVDSTERQSTSNCLANLHYDPHVSLSIPPTNPEGRSAVSVSFVRKSALGQDVPLTDFGLEPGALVIVSCDTATSAGEDRKMDFKARRYPMHLVRGIIQSISASRIAVRGSVADLERMDKLVSVQSDTRFRIDKDHVATGISTLRQNIVNLFSADTTSHYTAGNRLQRLRDAIVRLRRPSFNDKLQQDLFTPPPDTPLVPGCDFLDLALEYAEMNPDQQLAITAAFTATDYTLIQGFPGSGKTSTITFLIRLLAAHDKRILVTSYTNAAVDNVVLKLMDKGVATTNSGHPLPPLVRVGRPGDCHEGILPVMTSTIAEDIEKNALTQGDGMELATFVRRTIDSAKIVAVTVLTAPRSPQLLGQQFDVVIVDEAGQISQPAIIGALMSADTFVLVGDHMQLPPLVSSELAEKGGYGVSMLKLLADAHPDVVAKLSFQYRMNADICQMSNDLIYNGALKCANDNVRNQMLVLTGYPENVAQGWLRDTLNPAMPVVFINTDSAIEESFTPLEHTRAGKTVNATESTIVRNIVGSLVDCGVQADTVGVISPFRAQVHFISKCPSIATAKTKGLEVSTIDRYQGRDKAVIIISFVRSNEKKKVGRLLEDFRRLNVAVTRAKCKLIMVGSFSTIFHGSKAMKPALCRLKNRQQVLDYPTEASTDTAG